MIELRNITKLYGTVIGVNDISASLAPGAYGLVGPNGSGKTTLLSLITGQLRPTMGSIRVFGEAPWNRDALLRTIGLCPAVDVLFSNVSALDWVRYLVELHGFGRREARRRAEQALDQVGMTAHMKRMIGTYSLGMRQRTKLAQAFAHDPELLILDEPFNGLDPIGRFQMTSVLRAWIRAGRSLILASHILHEVEAISPSFLLIRGGRLLASGPAEEVHTMVDTKTEAPVADVASAIRIRCSDPRLLARKLVESGLIESISFVDNRQVVLLATCQPNVVFERLPHWLDELNIRVDEMQSPDESLENLFSSLMRMHRGEVS